MSTRTRILFSIFFVPISISAHRPVFSTKPQTNAYKEWIMRWLGFYEQESCERFGASQFDIWYGLTNNITLTADWNNFVNRNVKNLGSLTRIGKLELGMRCRFYKKDWLGGSAQATYITNIALPTETKKNQEPLEPSSVDLSGILAGVYETTRWYVYGNLGWSIPGEKHQLKNSNAFLYSIAVAYRLEPIQEDTIDMAYMLEINGTQRGHEQHRGTPVPGTKGHILWIGPSLGFAKPGWIIRTGMQMAVAHSHDLVNEPEFRWSAIFSFVI